MADWSQFELEGGGSPQQSSGMDMSQFELEQPKQDLLGADASPAVASARAGVGALSSFLPFGDRIVAGGSGLVDALDNWGAGNGFNLGNAYDARLQEVRDYQKAAHDASPLASGVIRVGGALQLPVPEIGGLGAVDKIGLDAATAGGYGSLFSLSNQKDLTAPGVANEAAHDFSRGALLGGGLSAIAEGASAAAPWLAKQGEALQRNSLGARQSDYQKAAENIGPWDIANGAVASDVKNAINDLQARGELGSSASGDKILANVVQKESDLGHQIGSHIDSYDLGFRLGGRPPVYPDFSNTRQAILDGEVNADQIPSYLQALNDYENSIRSQGGGSLRFLQEQKKALRDTYEQGNGPLNNYNQMLYHDLQRSIEGAVPEVGPLNQELAKYKLLRPLFDRSLGVAEKSNLINGILQKIRTSGGGGSLALAGGAIGGQMGGLVGAGLGAGLGFASTPQGQLTLGRGLSGLSSVFSGPGVDSAASVFSPLVGEFAGSNDKPLPQGGHDMLPALPAMPPQQHSSLGDLFSPANANAAEPGYAAQDPTTDLLLDAVRKVESGGNIRAVSGVGAKGPYQIMDATGRQYFDKLKNSGILNGHYNPFDEYQSRIIARSILQDNMKAFDGNITKAVQAYHDGIGNVKKGVMGKEGAGYVPKVTDALATLLAQSNES